MSNFNAVLATNRLELRETTAAERLGEYCVDVWFISPPGKGVLDLPSEVLSDEELRRASSYWKLEHQQQYRRYHSAMRIILGYYLAVSPQNVVLETHASGKPKLGDDALEFNLSHCAQGGIFAVSRSFVGADVEVFHNLEHLPKIVSQICSAKELRLLQNLHGDSKARAILHLWCRKEAVLKADGIGLMSDPRRLQAGLQRKSVRLNGFKWGIHPLLSLPQQLCGYVAAPLHIEHIRELRFG